MEMYTKPRTGSPAVNSPQRVKAGQAMVISSVGFLLLVFMVQTNGVSAGNEDCVGKLYGFPGCPLLESSSSSSAAGVKQAPATCGNNVVDAGEECDMGRFNGERQCTSLCTLLFCGDGKLSPEIVEECEPKVEKFYALDPQTKELIVKKRFAALTCDEEFYCAPPDCDEDGVCKGGCKQQKVEVWECPEQPHPAAASAEEPPTAVTASSAASSSRSPLCGNGVLDLGEQCDDGNAIHTDQCPNTCLLPHCGDGAVHNGEQCDDGNQINGDACSNSCQLARCGDGVVQSGEQCDDGNLLSTDTCTGACQQARCGDSVVQIGESCDDGNQINSDACSNACKAPTCGDNVIQAGEECDDGNASNSDGCSNSCRSARCGDRIVQLGEQCDDANDINTDSCTNACRKAACGDGIVQVGEQCDDGNQISNDLCSNLCRSAACGDGVVDTGEQCDGGEDCSDECTAVAATIGGVRSLYVWITAGAAVVILGIFSFILRKQIASIFHSSGPRGKGKNRSIDDIPLDEIEMPWHSW